MDGQAVALDLDLLFPGGKGPNEAELFYVLGDVDEATRPDDTVVELWAFTFPQRSTSAKPSTAISNAPPS